MTSIASLIQPTQFAYNGANAVAAYASESSPKLYSTINKIRSFIIALDITALAYSTYQLYSILDPNYSLLTSLFTTVGEDLAIPITLLGTLATGLLLHKGAEKIVNYVNNRFWGEKESKGIQEKAVEDSGYDIKLKFKKPDSIINQQALTVMRLVSSVTLALISTSPFFYLGLTAFQGYTLYKASQEKWIKLDVEVPASIASLPEVNSITMSYFQRLFSTPKSPSKKTEDETVESQKEENCTVCHEEKPEDSFCQSHYYHTACMIPTIFNQMKAALIDNVIKVVRLTTIRQGRFGEETGRSTEYQFKIRKKALPNCPLCRKPAVAYNLAASVNIDRASAIRENLGSTHAKIIEIEDAAA